MCVHRHTKQTLVSYITHTFPTPKCSHAYTYTHMYVLALSAVSPHMRNIMRAEFMSKVIRPPGLISWLSASSPTLSRCGRHGFGDCLDSSIKKEKVIAFCFIPIACMTNQVQQ